MNPVSIAKPSGGAGPPAPFVQPPPIAVGGALSQAPFGLVMANARAGAQDASKVIAALTSVRPSIPLHSEHAARAGATEPRDGMTVVSRRSARGSESLERLPRRNVGSQADLAAWLAPSTWPVSTAPEVAVRGSGSLEALLPALVRRVAWSSDGKRGTARLEIGSGELAGATLLVHADAGRVRVRLEVPPGVDARSWRERIVQRLAARDVPVDDVEVL
jgi:hypothetical protein